MTSLDTFATAGAVKKLRSRSLSNITVLLSLVCVLSVLLFPGHPREFVVASLQRIPLEFPALVLLLMWVRHSWARWLCYGLVVAMGLLLLLRMADIGSYLAFNRRFSPLLELHLVADGWNLASTAIGPVEATAVALMTLLLLALLVYLLFRCLVILSQLAGPVRQFLTWISSVVLVVGGLGIGAEYHFSYDGPLEAKILPEFAWRITNVTKSIKDQKQFISELETDTATANGAPEFSQLAGRDVIIMFVESYGRGYLDAERFTKGARERLRSVDNTISAAGLSARSGWLTSPIRGGRSWLAHTTFHSGLEIDNQARFDRLITTDRDSINSLFSKAGWHSVGLMPAIQFDWPEGVWYGYEDLRESADMEYAGERFGYATMPDQYTLSYFENAIRAPHDGPIVATMALISTHAPWTPIPVKLDWDLVGDGSVYDGTHRFGERVSWKYRSKVQDMYSQTLDYTLDVIGEYMARYADDALFIVLGDHQPPPIINGWGANADVPVHIITRDERLLDNLSAEHWMPGMSPDDSVASQPMRSFRGLVSNIFE